MNDKKKETLFFLTKLLALSTPLYLILWLGIDLSFLQEIVTRVIYSFLNLTGTPAERYGFSIVFRDFSFYISKDCTGWKGMLFLMALIISTKSTWKKRLVGFTVGLPAFFSFNLLRILFMIWVGLSNPVIFYLLHEVLWQLSMIMAVLVLWLMWARLDINNLKNRKNS